MLGGKVGKVRGDCFLGPDLGVEFGLVIVQPGTTFGRARAKFAVFGWEGADGAVDDFAWLRAGRDRGSGFGGFCVRHDENILR